MATSAATAIVQRTQLHYMVDVKSNTNGKTIVFLSGWPDHCPLNFASQIKHLEKTYRIVMMEIPGYELNEVERKKSIAAKPYLGYPFNSIVKMFLVAVADCMKGRKAIEGSDTQPYCAISHDWGSAIATNAAWLSPAFAQRLVILDVATPAFMNDFIYNPKAILIYLWYQLTLAFLIFPLPKFVGDFAHRFFATHLLKTPNGPNSYQYMAYMYFQAWISIFTLQTPKSVTMKRKTIADFSEFDETPVLFLWGKSKPFNFHSKLWLDYVDSKNKKDGKSMAKEMNGNHWFFQHEKSDANSLIEKFLS